MVVRIKPSANGWRVTKNGVTKSRHIKKRRAVQSGKSLASSGEQFVIHRKDGTIQDNRRAR